MNRAELLHATPDVAVRRFDHPPHDVHEDPDEEMGTRLAIAFVRSGTFDVVLDGVVHHLSAGSVFITSPGLTFRCQHHEQCPTDVCISVGFEASDTLVAESVWAKAGWVARHKPTPRLAYVDRRLQRAVDDGDQFEIERWGIGAAAALHADTTPIGSRGRYAVRGHDVDAVVASCRSIEASSTALRSVADRARDVGHNSTSLTHAYRRYVGISPHQYVVRCRLTAAADMLDTNASVSEACYRSGFENLSHFCRAFLRAFGVRASHWRALSVREKRRKVQALRRAPP